MEYIKEDVPVIKNITPRGSLRVIGDSMDFGKAPVPRQPSTGQAKPEVAKKDWGIRLNLYAKEIKPFYFFKPTLIRSLIHGF